MSTNKEKERKYEVVDLVLGVAPPMFLERQQLIKLRTIKNDNEVNNTHSLQPEPDFSALDLLADAAELVSVAEQKQEQEHLQKDLDNKVKVDFELPIEFKQKIQDLNGRDVIFVLQKNLYKSDINKNEGRLSIPPKKISTEFLMETEKFKLDERDEKDKIVGMDVLVLDPCLRECTICFKKWIMSRGSVYYLTGSTWNNVVQNNDLKVDDTL